LETNQLQLVGNQPDATSFLGIKFTKNIIMLRKDKKGFFVINSLEQLTDWYKLTNETQQEKNKIKEEKIKEKDAKKTNGKLAK